MNKQISCTFETKITYYPITEEIKEAHKRTETKEELKNHAEISNYGFQSAPAIRKSSLMMSIAIKSEN